MPPPVTVVLPALDEADALPAALAGAPLGEQAWRVLVVDNGSTDGTGDVARALGAEVVREPVRGFGAACWAGVQAAEGSRVVAFMDADATLTWQDLQRVVAPVLEGRADLVLGRRARHLREPGSMPWHVAAANAFLAWQCRRIGHVDVHDIGPLRAIDRDALLGLGMRDRSYGWPLEMVLRAGRAGLSVAEVDVTYRVRVGTSKVTGRPWPSVKAAVRMTRVLLRHRRRLGRARRTGARPRARRR
ncbi:MAG TPA: glycosyltransferase family 2 protein [Euzebya sp.]|nr:glycosyltransferase family 2 protein [Euzebya sp.]